MDELVRDLNHHAFGEADPLNEDVDLDEMELDPGNVSGILNLTYPVDPYGTFPSVTLSYQINNSTTSLDVLNAIRAFYNQYLNEDNIAAYKQLPTYDGLRSGLNVKLAELFYGYIPLGLVRNPNGYTLVFAAEDDNDASDNFVGL